MNEHVKEVFDALEKLPLKVEEKQGLREVFLNGARTSKVISEKELQELRDGNE